MRSFKMINTHYISSIQEKNLKWRKILVKNVLSKEHEN